MKIISEPRATRYMAFKVIMSHIKIAITPARLQSAEELLPHHIIADATKIEEIVAGAGRVGVWEWLI